MEDASGDMAALAERTMEAAAGAGDGAEFFGMLGIKATDAGGKLKSQEQIFGEVITSLQGMEDVTKRNAIATALMGTTGEELGPILNMTGAELEAMKKKAKELGLVMSQEAIDANVKYAQTLADLKSTFNGVWLQISNKLLPIFQAMLNWISTNMPSIKNEISYAMNTILDNAPLVVTAVRTIVTSFVAYEAALSATRVATTTMTIAQNIQKAAIVAHSIVIGLATAAQWGYLIAMESGSVAAGVMAAAQWAWNAAMVANPIGLVISLVVGLVAIGVLLYKNWDKITAKAHELWNKFKVVFAGVAESVKSGATSAINFFKELPQKASVILDQVIKFFGSSFNKIASFVGGLGSSIASGFNSTVNWLSQLPGKISSFFVNGFQAITGFMVSLPSKIAYGIGYAVGFMGTWLSQLPGRIAGFLTQIWQNIKTFAAELPGMIANGFNAMVSFVSQLPARIMSSLQPIIGAVLAWGGELINNIGTFMASLPQKAVEGFSAFYLSTTTWLSNIYTTAVTWIQQTITSIGTTLSQLPTVASEALLSFLQAIEAWGSNTYNSVVNWFSKIPEFVTNIINGAIDKVKNLGSTIWNAVKGVGSSFAAGEQAGQSVAWGVTPHAAGGILTSPHIGLVAEAGPEAVIPLDGSTRAMSIWTKAGQILGAHNNNAGSFFGAGGITNQVAKNEFTFHFHISGGKEEITPLLEKVKPEFEAIVERVINQRDRQKGRVAYGV